MLAVFTNSNLSFSAEFDIACQELITSTAPADGGLPTSDLHFFLCIASYHICYMARESYSQNAMMLSVSVYLRIILFNDVLMTCSRHQIMRTGERSNYASYRCFCLMILRNYNTFDVGILLTF